MEKFELSHVVLYTKKWYHATDDIFRDLRFALTIDGYSGEYFKDLDIIYKLLSECEKLDGHKFKMSTLYNNIQPYNTFMFGYTHNQTPEYVRNTNNIEDYQNDYDFNLAILYYIISSLRFIDTNSWIHVHPIYGKGLSKPHRIKTEDVNEMFKTI